MRTTPPPSKSTSNLHISPASSMDEKSNNESLVIMENKDKQPALFIHGILLKNHYQDWMNEITTAQQGDRQQRAKAFVRLGDLARENLKRSTGEVRKSKLQGAFLCYREALKLSLDSDLTSNPNPVKLVLSQNRQVAIHCIDEKNEATFPVAFEIEAFAKQLSAKFIQSSQAALYHQQFFDLINEMIDMEDDAVLLDKRESLVELQKQITAHIKLQCRGPVTLAPSLGFFLDNKEEHTFCEIPASKKDVDHLVAAFYYHIFSACCEEKQMVIEAHTYLAMAEQRLVAIENFPQQFIDNANNILQGKLKISLMFVVKQLIQARSEKTNVQQKLLALSRMLPYLSAAEKSIDYYRKVLAKEPSRVEYDAIKLQIINLYTGLVAKELPATLTEEMLDALQRVLTMFSVSFKKYKDALFLNIYLPIKLIVDANIPGGNVKSAADNLIRLCCSFNAQNPDPSSYQLLRQFALERIITNAPGFEEHHGHLALWQAFTNDPANPDHYFSLAKILNDMKTYQTAKELCGWMINRKCHLLHDEKLKQEVMQLLIEIIAADKSAASDSLFRDDSYAQILILTGESSQRQTAYLALKTLYDNAALNAMPSVETQVELNIRLKLLPTWQELSAAAIDHQMTTEKAYMAIAQIQVLRQRGATHPSLIVYFEQAVGRYSHYIQQQETLLIKPLKNEISKQRLIITDQNTKITTLQNQLTVVEKELATRNQQLQIQQKTSQDLSEKNKELAKAVTNRETQIKSLQEQLVEREHDRLELITRIANLEALLVQPENLAANPFLLSEPDECKLDEVKDDTDPFAIPRSTISTPQIASEESSAILISTQLPPDPANKRLSSPLLSKSNSLDQPPRLSAGSREAKRDIQVPLSPSSSALVCPPTADGLGRPASAASDNAALTNGSTAVRAGCFARQPLPSEGSSSSMTSSSVPPPSQPPFFQFKDTLEKILERDNIVYRSATKKYLTFGSSFFGGKSVVNKRAGVKLLVDIYNGECSPHDFFKPEHTAARQALEQGTLSQLSLPFVEHLSTNYRK